MVIIILLIPLNCLQKVMHCFNVIQEMCLLLGKKIIARSSNTIVIPAHMCQTFKQGSAKHLRQMQGTEEFYLLS